MPDLLTHYATSLLIATRALPLRHALLFALVGLLPDVDALLKIHRSATALKAQRTNRIEELNYDSRIIAIKTLAFRSLSVAQSTRVHKI